jgi:hypothetical protein
VEKSADLAIRASVARTKEHLTGVLEDLRNASFLPTLYFDDTDRLLGAGGTADPSSLVQQFFGPLFRWLSELPCGVLCSAQPEYLQLPVCHEATQRGLIQETINVPPLTSAEQIRRVLAVHVGAHELSEDAWNSALDDAAVDELFALYEGGTAGGLRRPVRLVELATRIAVERASERISVSLIRAALDELM